MSVLPIEVELLRVLERDCLRGGAHAGTRARTIAEPACSCTRWVSSISIPSNPARLELALEALLGQGAGDAPGPLLHVSARCLVHLGVGNDVCHGEAPAGSQDPRRLAEDRGLVGREVDHAVGDDHVDRVVGQRHRLDRSLQELDVLDPGLALVGPGQLEHLVGHVEAIGLAARPDPPRREQHIYATARAEVEHRLTVAKLGDRGRVAAAERGELGGAWELPALPLGVELGAEVLEPLLDANRVSGPAAAGARAAAGRLAARSGTSRRLRVALAYGLPNLVLALQLLSHPLISSNASGLT